jgi:GTPase SAR1 family protein
MLNALEPFGGLNILILGETGVGKSTFINAFVNYLTYDTLDDAMKAKGLNCIIPFSFATQVVDKNDPSGRFVQTTVHTINSPRMICVTNNIQVRAGDSTNEQDGSKGQSATQKTLVRSVQIGNYSVRLFDTPGIGDTRGASQDTQNMADILSVLSNYEKLHGIVILLKPNNARLTLMFRFCIKELLTHLHRDAARNMVFGFTNTRGSNYTPGDTFAPLKTELESNKDVNIDLIADTVYCFDSEIFRYLAAYHQGVDLGDRADYERNWEKSAKESQRLLTFFQKLTPHRVKSTVSLNETRHMITELTKPMAEIMRTVTATIKMNQEQIKSLSEDQLRKHDLEKQLFVTMKTLKAYKLDRPRTVYSHAGCVDHQDDGTDPNSINLRVVYKTHCHSPCYLTNVPADKIAHPALISCAAIDRKTGFCSGCGHSWQQHLHVLYELRPEQQTMKSKDAESKIYTAKSIMEKKEIAIEQKKQFMAAIKSEHDQIERAAIRLCLFLKKNSITPYNDATSRFYDQGRDGEGSRRR